MNHISIKDKISDGQILFIDDSVVVKSLGENLYEKKSK